MAIAVVTILAQFRIARGLWKIPPCKM